MTFAKKRSFIDLLEAMLPSRGKCLLLFPYVCTDTKTRSYHRDAIIPSSSCSRISETNRCFMNLQQMSRSVVSWNSALQTDPLRFAAICKPSVALFPRAHPHPQPSSSVARRYSC